MTERIREEKILERFCEVDNSVINLEPWSYSRSCAFFVKLADLDILLKNMPVVRVYCASWNNVIQETLSLLLWKCKGRIPNKQAPILIDRYNPSPTTDVASLSDWAERCDIPNYVWDRRLVSQMRKDYPAMSSFYCNTFATVKPQPMRVISTVSQNEDKNDNKPMITQKSISRRQVLERGKTWPIRFRLASTLRLIGCRRRWREFLSANPSPNFRNWM